MTKHPPNRRGISFEVGAQLEARDRLKNWYPAHIEDIDYEEGKVLIHFKRWNHRYDEWFCWDSPYLRPLEKIQLRKEGLHEEDGSSEFQINEQVLACWSDCRFYPARVTAVNKDGMVAHECRSWGDWKIMTSWKIQASYLQSIPQACTEEPLHLDTDTHMIARRSP